MKDFITVRQATEISGLDKQMILHHYRKGRFPAQLFADVLAIQRKGFEAFLVDYRAGKYPVGRPKK
jgi:hypothetical protein